MYTAEMAYRGPNSTYSEVEEGDDEDNFEEPSMKPDPTKPCRVYNALVPILLTVVSVLGLMILSGVNEVSDEMNGLERQLKVYKAINDTVMIAEIEEELALLDYSATSIFGRAEVFDALLNGTTIALIVSILLNLFQKIASLKQNIEAVLGGFKSLVSSALILILVWALSSAARDIGTARWLMSLIPEGFPPVVLIVVIFIISSAISYSTGTAWGTLSLIIPLAVPLAHSAAPDNERVLLSMIAVVLGGSVLGNHLSILGDTTILASSSARCELVEHVKTQTPYGFVVAGVVCFLGHAPTAMGLHPFFAILLCTGVFVGIFMYFGKPVPVYVLEDTEPTAMTDLRNPNVQWTKNSLLV
ncbi:hypothetical protein GEMRC1_001724 [Eukaryota sp. GEM-RC1]